MVGRRKKMDSMAEEAESDFVSFGLDDCVLPRGLLTSILSTMPVKVLSRCKFASKALSYLIDDMDFVKFHYESYEGLPTCYKCVNERSFHLSLPPHMRVTKKKEEDHVIVCYCMGMLCLGRPSVTDKIIFLNPATRMWKELERSKVKFGYGSSPDFISIGFGCNFITMDFTITRITRMNWSNARNRICVEVYSSMCNAWKKVDQLCSYNVYRSSQDTIVRGLPCWEAFCEKKKECMMIKFDASSCQFSEIALPSVIAHRIRRWVDFKDHLCGFLLENSDGGLQVMEAWVYLEETRSWICHLRLELGIGSAVPRFGDLDGRTGIVVAECSDFSLLFVNVNDRTIDRRKAVNWSLNFQSFVNYKESVACVQGMEELPCNVVQDVPFPWLPIADAGVAGYVTLVTWHDQYHFLVYGA